ncbi:MAG: hypothetical protein LBD52_05685 [Prevotellaceae bacterium]|nr:hypothetical protein [Prevotellaceae bacterium]
MATTTKKITRITTKKITKNKTGEPEKLSKYGEWLLKHPNGMGKILDMEAVLQ